jgi:hypothetical protein
MPMPAAQILHQVNRPLASATSVWQRAKRDPCRGQKAEHDRDATHDLRPEHFIVVGDTRLKRAEA